MTEQERKAMARRVTICRLANNITQRARKLADDPEKVAEVLPVLKGLMRELEEAART